MKTFEILAHPRLQQLLRGATPTEKFLLVSVLRNADDADLHETLDALYPAGPDFSAVVVGMPLAHWLGKSHEQLTRELTARGVEDVDESIDEINSAIKDRTGADPGVDTQEDQLDVFDRRGTNPGGAELTPRDPANLSPAQRRAVDAVPPGGVRPETREPTFGDENLPASELFGLSDAELLDIPGIGPATVRKLRTYQAERGVKLPGEPTTGGVVAPTGAATIGGATIGGAAPAGTSPAGAATLGGITPTDQRPPVDPARGVTTDIG